MDKRDGDAPLIQNVARGLTLHQKALLGLMAGFLILGAGLNVFRTLRAQSLRERAVQELRESPAGGFMPLPGQIAVQIDGGVENPGTYEIDEGAKLYGLIERAGGLTLDADASQLNMARTLHDQDKVVIPKKSAGVGSSIESPPGPSLRGGAPEGGPSSPSDVQEAPDFRIDINRASQQEFERLEGIGPKLAERIVRLRGKRGPFRSIEEIMLVDGIGTGKFKQIERNLYVESPSQ